MGTTRTHAAAKGTSKGREGFAILGLPGRVPTERELYCTGLKYSSHTCFHTQHTLNEPPRPTGKCETCLRPTRRGESSTGRSRSRPRLSIPGPRSRDFLELITPPVRRASPLQRTRSRDDIHPISSNAAGTPSGCAAGRPGAASTKSDEYRHESGHVGVEIQFIRPITSTP